MIDEEGEGAQERSGRVRPLFWFAGLAAGLLGPALLPSLLPRRIRCDLSAPKSKADILVLTGAVERYALEHEGAFPSSLLDLVTPDENGFRYLDIERVPRDPWGREYQYFPPGLLGPEAVVRSLGSDGAVGGSGEAQDLDNLALRSGKL